MTISVDGWEPRTSLLVADDLARGLAGDRKVPVPMMPSECIRIETAVLMAGKCDRTIRNWAKTDGIGRTSGPNGNLEISSPALLMRTEGQFETLERFRNGERDHPAVQFYLRKASAWLDLARTQPKLLEKSRL